MTSVITSPEEARAWLEGHDLLLCDCDGVLWRGAAAIPQVADAIEKLRRVYGKRVLFVTNNATKSRAQQVEKLAHTCGIAATEDDVLSSAYAAAMWAEQRGLAGRAAYIIGQKGLADELRAVGMTVHGPEDNDAKFGFGGLDRSILEHDIAAVVVGFDGAATYYKIAKACTYLRYKPECAFIATNRDLTFPDEHLMLPGGGTMVAAVEAGSGRSPDVVAGKPSANLLEIVEAATGVPRDRIGMIGDRLDTDILFGNHGGLRSTLLVYTGVTTPTQVAALPAGDAHVPTHAIASLGDLAHLL